MSEARQMNFQIRPETRDRIREIARMTFRGYGDTVDWLVAEAWERINKIQQEKQAVEEAITQEG